jgi:hypothetical protein
MAKELSTEIIIKASPEKVWAVLADFENYPAWNPFIKSLTGEVKVGNTIMAKMYPPDGSPMTFKPTVLAFDKNKELRWVGHLLIKGLFDGEHKFELKDNGNGTTTFYQSEKFKGILVPLFAKRLDKNTKHGFELMNAKLKELTEKEF